MESVNLKITNCSECPNIRSDRFYTPDPWETVYEWKCTIYACKRIYLKEPFDPIPPIPTWCPLRTI